MTNSPRNRVCFFHYLAGIFVFLWLSTALLHPLSAVENHMSAKLDPTLVGLALFGTDSRPFTLSKSIARNDSITVFIRSGKMDALRQAGYAIHPLSETVATAFLPFRQILDLSYREDVEGIETASLCRPALDVSTVDIRAKEVWTGFGGGYTGKGVIVGIIDSGIDWQHEDFIRADGTSRLLYIWDQTDDAGSGPAGYTIKGSLYSRAQINDELDGTPKGLVRQKDTHGHGTHVAGIAAGNGRGTGEGKDPGTYVGVAPEAEIIVVKAGDGSYGTVNISEGIRFVFDKAHELNMPAVVNVSLGTLFGSHDGTSDFERGLNELLVDPGRAVVVAAGNEGNKPVHFKKVFSSLFQNVTSIPFQINDNRNGLIDQFSFNVWYTNSSLSVSVITPSGRTFGPVASGSLPQQHNTGEGQLYIYNALTGKDLDNGDRQIRIDFSDSGNDHSSMDNLAV
ncbi:MAG TPA: S8 family serine peptidase, partial [bacterium]